MIKPRIKISASGPKRNPILDATELLRKNRVYVGIPEKKSTRKNKEPINNAQLLFIHTNGSPLKHIPARPVVEPAIEASDNKASINRGMKIAAEAALDGKPQQVKQGLRLAGMDAQSRVKAWFTDPRNGWAPNAPGTIRRKKSDKPLIDTAQMRNAIVYVLRDEE